MLNVQWRTIINKCLYSIFCYDRDVVYYSRVCSFAVRRLAGWHRWILEML